MHYPEFDVLCHEVAGKLSELRRLTMETPVLTDEQEALLAELTRLLRLLDAVSSQQLHSLLGDTATPDSAFLTELYEELPLLAKPAERVSHLPRPRPSATPSSPPAPSSREEGQQCGGMPQAQGNSGVILEELTVSPDEARSRFPLRTPLIGRTSPAEFLACDFNGSWWLVQNRVAQRFLDRKSLDQYLATRGLERGEGIYRADEEPLPSLGKNDPDEEPDAPVPSHLLPNTPVLAGGNARRLEEALEESEG